MGNYNILKMVKGFIRRVKGSFRVVGTLREAVGGLRKVKIFKTRTMPMASKANGKKSVDLLEL